MAGRVLWNSSAWRDFHDISVAMIGHKRFAGDYALLSCLVMLCTVNDIYRSMLTLFYNRKMFIGGLNWETTDRK
jgi:hypothetical protein